MTRILIDCTYVFEHPGENSGIQRVVRNVAAELPRLGRKYDVRAVAFRDGRLFEVKALTPRGLERRVRAAKDFGQVAERLAARLAARRLKPLQAAPGDQLLLLDSSWHSDVRDAVQRLKGAGVGVVAVVHDLVPITHPHFCVPGLVEDFSRWLQWVTQVADGYLAVSKTVLADLEPRVLQTRSSARPWFDYCHHGSRLDLIDAAPVDPRIVDMFGGGRPVYLTVGTLEPRKNHGYALDAFDLLWADGFEGTLCLVGKRGWKVDRLIDRIESHSFFGERLFLFDSLDDVSLAYAYDHARALIYPSHAEGFGLPMVEAMGRGTPVMASDIPIFHETGGDFAAYFDLRQPSSLAALVAKFDATGRFPAKRPLLEWRWRDWATAARELIEKVAAHAVSAAPPPTPVAAPLEALSPFQEALRKADGLRDERCWEEAARAYEQALGLDPTPAGIWVQLGHMLKESGKPEAAVEVYTKAQALAPADADIERQLGHVWKRLRDPARAARHYLRALELDPTLLDLGYELGELAQGARLPGVAADSLGRPPREPGRFYFDIYDAFGYFTLFLRPTGIQRVQLEILHALLADASAGESRVCVYTPSRQGWVELPAVLFHDLYAAIGVRGDGAAEVRSAAGKIAFYLKQGPILDFPDGAVLVNLGVSWTAKDYFADLERARRRRQVAFVPFMFDLIPVRMPLLCERGAVGDFFVWFAQAARAAQAYVAISENTKADLLQLAAFMGQPIDPSKVVVARLDAQFGQPAPAAGDDALLGRLGITSPYVLFVSTIEPRKNHLAAFAAWRLLSQRLGAKTPVLVCAGKWGWDTDEIREARAEAGDLVQIVSGLADEDLGHLYANALFTLYPSHYEGWGLPVTEALCHGKTPLSARNSSLVEAGGDFADYFDANDVGDLAAKAERLIVDVDYRLAKEAHIAAHYRPRTWRDVANDVQAGARIAAQDVVTTQPEARVSRRQKSS